MEKLVALKPKDFKAGDVVHVAGQTRTITGPPVAAIIGHSLEFETAEGPFGFNPGYTFQVQR